MLRAGGAVGVWQPLHSPTSHASCKQHGSSLLNTNFPTDTLTNYKTIRVLRTDQSSRRHANERAGSDKQLPVQSAGKGTALMLP